jgi:hypothetical protein
MMRKFLFVALVSSALVVAMPATALARHHHRHHHHSRIRHEHFGTAGGTTTTTGGTTSGDEMQGTAGTVDSFTNGVLTIKLGDANGTLVSGMVTDATELKCEAPENQVNDNDGSDGGSGDRQAMEDGGGSQSGDNDSGDDNGDNNDQGEDGQMCSTANLTPGIVVQDAELNVSSAGAVWHEVELVTP